MTKSSLSSVLQNRACLQNSVRQRSRLWNALRSELLPASHLIVTLTWNPSDFPLTTRSGQETERIWPLNMWISLWKGAKNLWMGWPRVNIFLFKWVLMGCWLTSPKNSCENFDLRNKNISSSNNKEIWKRKVVTFRQACALLPNVSVLFSQSSSSDLRVCKTQHTLIVPSERVVAGGRQSGKVMGR